MQNSEFENRIQQKMEELKIPPSDTVWQQIEAGLPPEKRRRRWLVFILLFITLSAGSIFFWDQFKRPGERISENLQTKQKTDSQNATTRNLESPAQPFLDNTDSLKEVAALEESVEYINNKKKKATAASFKVSIKNSNPENFNDTDKVNSVTREPGKFKVRAGRKVKITTSIPVSDIDENFIAGSGKEDGNEKVKIGTDKVNSFTRKPGKFKLPADVRVKITTPIPVSDIDENLITGSGMEDGNEKIKIATADTAISTIVNVTAESQKEKNDSVNLLKKDTAIITATNKPEKKKKSSGWQYGIILGPGISTVKNQLFDNSSVFANAMGVFGGIPANQRVLPNDPTPGAAYNFGFYVHKTISSRWKFNTGLTYLYQFNKLQVGNRVDSSANFYFDNKSLEANGYYRPGDAAIYKNKFHLLEMPLLFQYRVSKKPEIYFEAGPTISYLVYSNAMIYNGSQSAYFTDNDLFNKFLLSFNAGAGINLAQKSKLPFSIGCQFRYSLGSIVKKTFGTQHLVNAVLYLKIPLKK